MKFNYSKERKKMEERLQRYIDQGMPVEMVQEMKHFERDLFNKKRSFYRNNQQYLSDELVEHLVAPSHDCSRYGWIDKVQNEEIVDQLLSLPIERLELITQYVFDGKNQVEIAEELGISQSAVAHKISRIKNKLKKLM